MPRGRPTLDLTGQRHERLVARTCHGYQRWVFSYYCGQRDGMAK
jgi:hypothetical protein